jgi:LemA protein
MQIVKDFLKAYRGWIFGFFLIIVGMNGCSSYNTLVQMNETVNSKWSQVENVYQRRMDLIPNLVEVVQGYAEHEKSTLTDVINARAKATAINIDASKLDANTLKQFEQAQSGLTQALSKLMVVSERYPELKANENYQQLMSEVSGSENRISVERKSFNDAVMYYNKKLMVMPRKLWANLFGFTPREYFKADPSAHVAPKIKMTK